jgi:hypothetical protein
LLRPGGRLIVSLPNIRHWKFIWRLLTRADFNYRDAGLLDRTPIEKELFGEGGLAGVRVRDDGEGATGKAHGKGSGRQMSAKRSRRPNGRQARE